MKLFPQLLTLGQCEKYFWISFYMVVTKPSYDGQAMVVNCYVMLKRFLRDTLKAAAVTLGTSARLHPWLLKIYEKEAMKYMLNMKMMMVI